jgi:two-component system, sensor histidine kinase and response regulator
MPKSDLENTVFVIDDDEIIRLSCEQILQKTGYKVETFGNGHEGIERLKEVRPPLLLVDIKMPELDGFEVIRRVRKIDPDIVIVVITGYATIETAVDAMKTGAYDFLPKPFTPSELRLIIARGFERWRLAKEAQLLRYEKEEVERKFVTLVSHQLKGPLGAVKQYLDVLLYGESADLSPKTREWISRSQVRISEMLSMIQDWLTLAKLDRGTFCDCDTSSDLVQVINSVIQECRQLPSPENIAVNAVLSPELPPVRGDSGCLNVLVENLVSNAFKYNKPGGKIDITAEIEDGHVILRISDTGIGIPESFRPHLFEEFYRLKIPETQDIPGTGLGLVICRRIVTELGGSIEIESEEGKYTTVTAKIPVAERPREVPGAD